MSIMIYQTRIRFEQMKEPEDFANKKQDSLVDSELGVGCSDEQVSDNFFWENKTIEFLLQFCNTNFGI